MIITIDGPAISGKSSVARILADRLDFYYLNTGLLYRAVGYILEERCKKLGINLASYVASLTRDALSFIKDIHYEYNYGVAHILYENNDITAYLTNAVIGQAASIVSASPLVRESLFEVQRSVGKRYNIVADGRDCGSVIFPDADYKFFLTASIESRVARLCLILNKPVDPVAIRADIEQRDKRDRERSVAPLTIPSGAIVLDNSQLTLEQSADFFLRHIKQ